MNNTKKESLRNLRIVVVATVQVIFLCSLIIAIVGGVLYLEEKSIRENTTIEIVEAEVVKTDASVARTNSFTTENYLVSVTFNDGTATVIETTREQYPLIQVGDKVNVEVTTRKGYAPRYDILL